MKFSHPDTERTPSGNFESTIQNGILKDGRYVLIVSTADDRPETTNSVSFMISGSTSKVIELYAISTTTPIYQGINLVITGSYNEVYYDQDGNRQETKEAVIGLVPGLRPKKTSYHRESRATIRAL